MSLILKTKKILNRYGFDIKKYHPFYETIVEPLGVKTILDVGANDGLYSKEMSSRFPEAKIFAFEPLSDCFNRLQKISKETSLITPLHYALGEENGTQTIQKSAFHPSSSILKMTNLHTKLFPKTEGSTEEKIQIRSLDSLINEITITEPLFIKIDVQGYEDKVLELLLINTNLY